MRVSVPLIIRVLPLFALSLLASSCTIRHHVQADYPKYLAVNSGASALPKTSKASLYWLTPQTAAYSYEFRAAVSGPANLWVVEIGKMLDDTLQSNDVQAAFGSLGKAGDGGGSTHSTLVFELQRYTFEQFGAHLSIKVALVRGGRPVFEKTYSEAGKTQGGKMFWAGAFGQKNAVQQSTKLAIDEILRDLISDLNAQP